jgi:integrase
MGIFPRLSELVRLPSGIESLSIAGSADQTQRGDSPMPYLNRGPQIFAGLCEDFIASPQFQSLAENTRRLWERELRQAGDLDSMGCLSLKAVKRHHVVQYLDSVADRPGKQEAALSSIRALEKWAMDRGFLQDPICYRITIRHESEGHKPWTAAQVRSGIAHARPDIGRMIAFGAWTGQRGSDLVRMSWEDIETINGRDWIRLVQFKTKRKLMVPIVPELAEHMNAWSPKAGPILRRLDGSAWERELLTKAWLYERRINKALEEHNRENLHVHGLRGHACVRLYVAGYTTRQVAQTIGMSNEMVEHYTRLSSQQAEAEAALDRMERAKNIG